MTVVGCQGNDALAGLNLCQLQLEVQTLKLAASLRLSQYKWQNCSNVLSALLR